MIARLLGLFLFGCYSLAPLAAVQPAAAPHPELLVRPDVKDPYLRVESDKLVGNQGEEQFDVSIAGQAACGDLWLFDHAELDIIRNRFSDVQFVQIPPAGCTRCEPVRVRWYHEPTGYLTFDVRVFRRLVKTACPPVAQPDSAAQSSSAAQSYSANKEPD